MQFTVPQFIEQEAKIAGPLTFRQLLWLAGAGGIIFFMYFTLAKTNPTLFTIITIFLIIVAVAFAFFQVGGYSFTAFLKNFMNFIISSKIYVWERKVAPIKLTQTKTPIKQEEKEKPTLRIMEKSKLKQLSTMIETK